MVWWALASLPKVAPKDLIFIVNSKHVEEYEIDKVLQENFHSDIIIIVQDELPTGQATTVLLARQEINNSQHLIIYNCDTYAPTTAHLLLKAIELYPDCDGFVPVFSSSALNLSYVKVDNSDIIKDVAEKKVISKNATIGLYHFKKGSDFIWAVEKMIENNFKVNGEYYVLPTYQYLIDAGKIFKKISVDEIHVLGTPDELNHFLKS